MPMNYKLRIKSLDVEDVVGEFNDVVRAVEWGVSAWHTDYTDSEGNPIKVHDTGIVPMTEPDVATFKAYDQITKQDIVAWIRDYYENRLEEEDGRVERWVPY